MFGTSGPIPEGIEGVSVAALRSLPWAAVKVRASTPSKACLGLRDRHLNGFEGVSVAALHFAALWSRTTPSDVVSFWSYRFSTERQRNRRDNKKNGDKWG